MKISERRDALQSYLKEQGIPAMIYYPKPLHIQPAYSYLGFKAGDFPVAESCSKQVLSLPMHTEMDQDQMDFICETINAFFQ